MVKAEAADDATLVVTFAEKRARDVPLYVAGLPIFSKAYYADAGVRRIDARYSVGLRALTRSENSRSIASSNSSASRTGGAPIFRSLAAVIISTSCATSSIAIAMSRSRDLRRRNYLFREEFTSRVWATRYDFPAVKDGRVKRETLPDETPSGAQGWFINTRRDKFKDPRVREALIQAFDFEWTNKTIMYGAYARTHSPFQNSDMVASGPPSPDELKLLEPFRSQVPAEVFGAALPAAGLRRVRTGSQPLAQGAAVASGSQACRSRMANGCCRTAMFSKSNFWSTSRHSSRIMAPYIKNLGTLGIEASIAARRSPCSIARASRISIST